MTFINIIKIIGIKIESKDLKCNILGNKYFLYEHAQIKYENVKNLVLSFKLCEILETCVSKGLTKYKWVRVLLDNLEISFDRR